MSLQPRRKTPIVKVGLVRLGSRYPVCIQSMTDTPTADTSQTLQQIKDLINAGAQMVRITVNDDAAARSCIKIIQTLRKQGIVTPIIGDFHFNGHQLLSGYPEAARLLDKYRINPGNIGRGQQRNKNFDTFIHIAQKHDKPLRIGINSGSLDPQLFKRQMDQNARRAKPLPARTVFRQAMVASALNSARYAMKRGLKKNKIVLSVKMSDVQDTINVYETLAKKSDFVLHLGLTEAGVGDEGVVASTAAVAILLQQGIGDTIRVSLTPTPNTPRRREVEVCQNLLQSLGLRYFTPRVISCPGCGRTQSRLFQSLAQDVKSHIQKQIPNWRLRYPGVEQLTVAVMGCVVNGPGESKTADIGISLPGQNEKALPVVFADGEKITVLSGPDLKKGFIRTLEHYIKKRFSAGS